MKLVPESLRTNVDTSWNQGNPPQPRESTEQHAWAVGDDGNLYHCFWDGQKHIWENLGQPPQSVVDGKPAV